ncbi:DNA circularization protein [Burkholderia cenocepacia]|uniref:DNA circularization protein n=1 Tax=Burkholderia cenocepacia TaxID=95486 RepID=UPI00209CA280|nr:DNA circularization N-terminal domain-containing protein [Burkholderia cenocepacia]MCO8326803.1 DNA circularization N-terminal domain-containing protein [Burkholderia cenocepacia]MCO8333866.1 DNA circularization N-terminal domain-containing protein [Burkholderia cenocepacia]MCO8341239.1 DNA circularization N-terminal domain-containing protein [Burkholderia cenocepacia]MCO8348659.1 DNA circularization N-terminal domain-containing protein [Burkholderia cenocepacia]MCO8361851.1 DNA circulariza
MAWKDTLQDASFRGVVFDVQRTDDPIEREVARYAYPYVDGEDIVDMGQKARETSLTAIFFGDDYEERLKTFLNAISQPGPGELVHPVFGSMPSMQFLGGHVSHTAENVDACQVELRFAKANPGNPFFTGEVATQRADATAQVAQTAQDNSVSAFATAMDALKSSKAGLRRLNALRDLMSDTLGPIRSLVTGFRSTVLDYVDFPRAFASDLIGLVSGVTDFRAFDAGLVMSDWSGLSSQMDSIVKLPASASSGETVTIPGTPASASSSSSIAAASRSRDADPVDVAMVSTLVSAVVATTMAGIASDVLANELDKPTLTPDDIESISNDTRTRLQTAIDDTRETLPLVEYRPVVEPMKDTALAVQELAVDVIDQLPPIVSRTIDSPSNLTLISFRWYGDYSRSAELMRLNPGIRNPNFVNRGDVLRGYAR